MSLYQNSVLKKYLAQQDVEKVDAAYALFRAYFHDPERQTNIRAAKEEQYQGPFMEALFCRILGYTMNPEPNYDLTAEFKNEVGARKADGAILKDDKAIAVIELKGTDTTDLDKINKQAFDYKNNQSACVYVITSNFEKLRFFIHNAVDHLEFDLFHLTREDFALLWLCLQKDNLLAGVPEKVKSESLQVEDKVTKQLYKDYSAFKTALWQDLCKRHPEHDQLLLFKKTQKLLDRFLFIFFAEDKGLLPPNSIPEIVRQWEKLQELDEYRPLYERFQKYFGYLNEGRKGGDSKAEIFAYNGGLFKPDELLDGIGISDGLLQEHVLKLSKYDFDSEVDVNILGHIFEHSLSEIENITAQLEGREVDKKKTKRKKDGVFYTPKYITKYIVENTVGRLCNEKKEELALQEEEYARERKGRQKKKLKELHARLDDYRKWLLSLTICDPACGSGAFLNQALEFLIEEHQYVDQLEAQLFGESIVFKDIGDHILERNIFGVDINEESVEIARLSLWLRTASKGRKLNDLSNNIKCGNSLIDDPEVAGDKAFDWQQEFPDVFKNGGFDVVIGNPPYVDIKGLEPDLVRALFNAFSTTENRINLYSIFIEKGYAVLKSKGILSFINPNSILVNSSYTKIRKLLIDDVTGIIKLPDDVFPDAKVETIIFDVRKDINADSASVIHHKKDEVISYIDISRIQVFDKKDWKSTDGYNYNIYIDKPKSQLLRKIENAGTPLIDLARFSLGITPYDKYKGHSQDLIKSRGFHADSKIDGSYKPLIAGENIVRYHVDDSPNEFIKYGDWLGAMRDEDFFVKPRVIVRQIVSGNPPRIYAGWTDKPLYFTQIGFGIVPDDSKLSSKVLAAFINSSLINFYHTYRFLDLEKRLFQKILIANCKKFPIALTQNGEIENKLEHQVNDLTSNLDQLAVIKGSFLNLLAGRYEMDSSKALKNWNEMEFSEFLKELKKAKVQLSLSEEAEWMAYFNEQKAKATALQQEIDRIDKHIDAMVYELYGLTEEEIGIVEVQK